MSELHQVLAVDRDLEATAKKIKQETIQTFTKRTEHFTGSLKTLVMFDEARAHEVDALAEEKSITTTVPERLAYTAGHIIRHLDCMAMKEASNQHAKADVILADGSTIMQNVPATVLLALERELKSLRECYETIPTLQPGVTWENDPDLGANIYRAVPPRQSHRSEKSLQVISLAKATKDHKEQVQVQNIDIPIGRWTTQYWSGMISPRSKADLLGRIDELLRAVKQARAIANKQEVITCNIGEEIFKYLHGPITS